MRPVLAIIGVAVSEGEFDLHSLFRVILIVSNSRPHITDMGGVESEPAFSSYSANLLQCCLGFKLHLRGSIL